MMKHGVVILVALVALVVPGHAFAPTSCASRPVALAARRGRQPEPEPESEPAGNPITNFFRNLDDFMDDATSRRLGKGAGFYGKRKSTFYGEADLNRKMDPRRASAEEDYQGPTNSGYFVWRKTEDGRMQPQTRLRGKAMERLIGNKEESDEKKTTRRR